MIETVQKHINTSLVVEDISITFELRMKSGTFYEPK